MGTGRTVAAALLAMAAAAGARAGQAGQTAQGAYNAGQAAFDAGHWAEAVATYATALRLMNPNSASVPVIRARRATALWNLRQMPAARTEARAAVARFAALGVTNGEDLATAWTVIGDIGRYDLDEPEAADAFAHAMAAADGPSKADLMLDARLGLALATMTSDPARASAALDAVLADPTFAAMAKPRQADILALRGRAALNRGDAHEAVRFITRAIGPSGGTTTRVTLAQVRMRGDAALIYAKLGDEDKVRQFLTFSGAGHLPDNGWLNRGENELPICGADIHPDDVAVVEFAIDDNGRTVGAAPIYASRGGPVGATFARAVRGWRWAPAYMKKLNPFWRGSIRIELRCVNRAPGVDLADAFREEVEAWAAAHGMTVDLSDPALKPGDVAANPSPAARVLEALLDAVQAGREPNWDTAATTASSALDAADAPTPVRAYVLRRMIVVEGHAGHKSQAQARLATLIAAIERRPDGARAAAWMRTDRAIAQEGAGDWAGARADLAVVTALSPAILSADDPVRTVAVLHQSMIDRRLGQGSAADARLAAAGLDARSCSILDVRPVATNTRVSSDTFPEEAARWHFEGTVREAFDINADGSVAGVRTVIAYPPLVFGPATERAVQRFRYIVPTLNNQPLGCAGQTVNVRYVLPE